MGLGRATAGQAKIGGADWTHYRQGTFLVVLGEALAPDRATGRIANTDQLDLPPGGDIKERGVHGVARRPVNSGTLPVERKDRRQGREFSHAGENDADSIAMAR